MIDIIIKTGDEFIDLLPSTRDFIKEQIEKKVVLLYPPYTCDHDHIIGYMSGIRIENDKLIAEVEEHDLLWCNVIKTHKLQCKIIITKTGGPDKIYLQIDY